MPGRTPLEQQQNAELKFSASNKEEYSKTPAAEKQEAEAVNCDVIALDFPLALAGKLFYDVLLVFVLARLKLLCCCILACFASY